MSKDLKKVLLAGASVLMLSSVGASFNSVNANAKRRVRTVRRYRTRKSMFNRKYRFRRNLSTKHLPFTAGAIAHRPASYLIRTTRPIKINFESDKHPYYNRRWVKKGTYLHAYALFSPKGDGYEDFWIVYNNKNVKVRKHVVPDTNISESLRVNLNDLNYRNSKIIHVYKRGFGQRYMEKRFPKSFLL